MQRHTSSWYIQSLMLILAILVALLTDSPASYASSTVFRASIGAGNKEVRDHLSVNPPAICGNSVDQEFTGFGGASTLLQSLPLLKLDTQWVPASVTEKHGSSPGGLSCCSTLGSSTYTSTLSADGIVTTEEIGSA